MIPQLDQENKITIAFDKALWNAIIDVWSPELDVTHLQELAAKIDPIIASIIAIGDHHAALIEDSATAKYSDYFIIYEWIARAKSFALLWRDVLFQEQKAWLQVSARSSNLSAFQELREQSKKVVEAAAMELRDQLNNLPSGLAHKKQMDRWKLQDRPWPIYKAQLEQIPTQCEALLKQSNELWNATGSYVLIRSHFAEGYQDNLKILSEITNDLQEVKQEIQQAEDFDVNRLLNELETIHSRLDNLDGIAPFKATLDEHLSSLPGLGKISIDTNQGMLLYKDLDLQKATRSWLESEVMTDIYNLYTIQAGITNKINLSIVNIRNRMAISKQDGQASPKQEIEQTLNNFLKSLEKSKEKIIELHQMTMENLNADFDLTKIYGENFLPQSLQYTINQYRDHQWQNWKAVREWCARKGQIFQQLRKNVREEEALSTSEKIVRVVRGRTPQKENSHYTNMFLTEGWISDSFSVPRTEESARIATLVENWRLGFRGGVMLTGKRFAGKTLFGEVISQQHFSGKTIRLKPKHKIQFEGRFFETTYDLGGALEFLVKYGLHSKAMVWIDDLELWQDEKVSLGANIESLLQTIDQTSSHLFFMVAMSNWLKSHLNDVFEIDKVFQSEINLDRMRHQDIQKAILIRHSATHMDLVNEDREEITGAEVRKIITGVCKLSEGNVGEALHRWAYNIQKYNEERVIVKRGSGHSLPEFLGTNAALILKTIIMERKTNEYQLRKLFGPAFKETYKVILHRLLNLGILKREGSWLEINPFLVNDIGEFLEQKNIIQFHNKKGFESKTRL